MHWLNMCHIKLNFVLAKYRIFVTDKGMNAWGVWNTVALPLSPFSTYLYQNLVFVCVFVCLCTCMCVYLNLGNYLFYIFFFFSWRSWPFAPKAVNPMNRSPPYQITILRSAYLDMSNYLSTKYSNQNAYQMKLKNLIGSAQE